MMSLLLAASGLAQLGAGLAQVWQLLVPVSVSVRSVETLWMPWLASLR
jgi:hypothetical protein